MVDEDTGTTRSVLSEPDAGQHGTESNPKAPGWYPTPSNPTDQNYWDGQNWTARRRWTAGKGWAVAGDAPQGADTDAAPAPAGRRLSANPYAPMASVAAAPRTKATGFTFNLGVLLLWICGIALMYGSVGSWVHVSGNVGIADFHVSFNGTDPVVSTLISVNGWVTFIGGILIVIFACFEMTSDELALDIFTAVVAAADHGLRHLRHVPHRAEDQSGADVGRGQRQRRLGPDLRPQRRRPGHAGHVVEADPALEATC